MERTQGIETSTINQTFNKEYLLQIYYNTKEMSQCLVQEWLWMVSAEVMLYCVHLFAFTVMCSLRLLKWYLLSLDYKWFTHLTL